MNAPALLRELAGVADVRAYASAVFRRCREPMEPLDFTVDWDDQPSRHLTYPGSFRLPLPPAAASLGSSGLLLSGEVGAAPWDLGTLLRLSYGVLDRRVQVDWNQDVEKRSCYPLASWGRGTASGGGMYPLELYVVSGPGGPVLPGVYHYATAHHALERLITGDVTPVVAAACGVAAPGYLLASVRFWKNSFKYNSFCYHVVSQDLGALLGSWDVLGRAMGVRLRRTLWFDESTVDELLGFDGETQSVFAIVPIPDGSMRANVTFGSIDAANATFAATPLTPGTPRVAAPAFERSKRTLRFEAVDRTHRATLVGPAPPPPPVHDAAPRRPRGPAVDLPTADVGVPHGPRLAEAFRGRRSAFGRFVAGPLGLGELGTLLAGAATGGLAPSDLKPEGTALTGLSVLANRVDGLAPGAYDYDPVAHRLHHAATVPGPVGEWVQRHYLLSNYNTDQAAAVIVITARLEPVLAAWGGRGYRALNTEVGAVAQATYLTAAALGTGCGAVLGIDNVAVDDVLGIGPDHDDDLRSFLFLLVGPLRLDQADVELRVAP